MIQVVDTSPDTVQSSRKQVQPRHEQRFLSECLLFLHGARMTDNAEFRAFEDSSRREQSINALLPSVNRKKPSLEACRAMQEEQLQVVPTVLDDAASPTLAWDDRAAIRNPFTFGVSHWGQAKLMVCELEFLSRIRNERGGTLANVVLVYAGAAPGHHLSTLLLLFQDLARAVLYDPQPITATFSDPSKVVIRRERFDEAASAAVRAEYPDADIVFVSDLRNTGETLHQFDVHVVEDMNLQRRCMALLEAKYALLKFRLPYVDARRPRVWDSDANAVPDTFTYLDGERWIQPFAPSWSTETRLFLKRSDGGTFATRLYDNALYENQCFAFNCGARRAPFHVPALVRQRVLGAEDNYDTARCVRATRLYLTNTEQRLPSDEQVARFLCTLFLHLWRDTGRSMITTPLHTIMADRLERATEWRSIVTTHRLNRQMLQKAVQKECARLTSLVHSQRSTLLESQATMVEEQLAKLEEQRAQLFAKIVKYTRAN